MNTWFTVAATTDHGRDALTFTTVTDAIDVFRDFRFDPATKVVELTEYSNGEAVMELARWTSDGHERGPLTRSITAE